ncbi:PAS domain S-box protein [Microvirga sp. 2MCAF38]|uniref:PAS domain S-box protein n=1 Tax=Microvirga sp. 2MCAF38 TaxID=3232989 RepID=UPI003F992D96
MNMPAKTGGNPGVLFPVGGGETGAMIRSFDWSKTSLGGLERWPQSLRSVIDFALHSPVPILTLWGADGIMIYNDAYSAFAGDRHPKLLGMPVLEGWPDLADFNRHVMGVGLRGGTLSYRDHHLVLSRNGIKEDVWVDLNYSPIRDENGMSAGVLAIVVETTERVLAEQRLAQRDEQIRYALDAAGMVGTWDWHVGTNKFYSDAKFATMFSVDPAKAAKGAEMAEYMAGIHPDDTQRVWETISGAIANREKYAQEFRLRQKDGTVRWIFARGECIYDTQGNPLRFPGAVVDVTERKLVEDAYQESEARLRAVFNTIPIGLVFAEAPSGRITDANSRAAEIVGHPVPPSSDSETDGMWISHSDTDGSVSIDDDPLFTALTRGETNEKELHYRRGDGTRAWIRLIGAPVKNADGRVRGGIATIIDIDREKKTELALRESEARFRVMADSAPALIWATDPENRIIFANRHYEQVFGISPQGLGDEAWRTVIHPDDVEGFFTLFAKASTARANFRVDARVYDKHNNTRWLRCEGVPRFDGAGTFLGYVGCNVDITESRIAADELEAKIEERTRERDSLWRVSRDLFCVFGRDGGYRSANPAWREALGYSQEDLVGKTYLDLTHPDDVPKLAKSFEVLKREGLVYIDLRVRNINGTYRWFSWTSVAEGDLFYASGRDITVRKELEEQLRQSQKMEAIGQLTGGIAHDFNNLLTGVVGSLELMQTRIAQGRLESIDRYINAAMSSANRAAALTHRLLAFARRQPLDPKPVALNHLVASMEDLVRRTMGEAIEVELVCADDLWLTLCDPNQLENALLNLVINARDAMSGAGALTIHMENVVLDEIYVAGHRDAEPGQYVTLCVTDTGAGMSPDTVARAFDPFFTTKPIGQGTGLGLSMVYGFAKQSEGQVVIDSEVAKGTSVRIFLPRYDGPAEEAAPSDKQAAASKTDTGETVLVVEDEPVVRGLIVDVLEDLGYRALQAADGPSGLKILEAAGHIDLLVTDIGLPGMNGRQLADHARKYRPDLKILFITGYAENAAIASGFLEVGMEMITKPFPIEVLTKRIRDMIEGA